MGTGVLAARVGGDRWSRVALALGALGGVVLVTAVDPAEGHYPTCPSQSLLGFDCPACGTLRGVHALTSGRVTDALDHNLLLAVAVPLGLVLWWTWVRAAIGRPARPRRVPAWVLPVVLTVLVTFTVLRNLPVDGLRWLDASA